MQQAERLAREHFALIENGDLDGVAANVSPDFVNLRSADEPLAARQSGPAGLIATIAWLRRAFSEIRFEVVEVIADDDRAVVRVICHGRQSGPFVVHDSPDGRVTQVFPPTGRRCAVPQIHWFRIRDGKVYEHDAVRDDLGMARQLGWVPPTPWYVARMALALRRERRRRP